VHHQRAGWHDPPLDHSSTIRHHNLAHIPLKRIKAQPTIVHRRSQLARTHTPEHRIRHLPTSPPIRRIRPRHKRHPRRVIILGPQR